MVSEKENLQVLAGFLVVSVLVFALDGVSVLKPIRFAGEFVALRAQFLVQTGVRIVASPIEAGRYLVNGSETVADLQARLSERIVDEVRLTELEAENERMRKLLGADLPPEWKFIPLKVSANGTQRMVVVGGSAFGIEKGDTVVDEIGAYVGVVLKTSEVYSEVLPVGATNSVVMARVNGEKTQGIVVNDANGILMEKILQEDKIEVGDVVETAGTDGVVPGVLIARVTEVVGQGSGVYKQAKLSLLSDPQSVFGVFVIKGAVK